jgi:glycosyltransferase involved in cell wall biosynthesis
MRVGLVNFETWSFLNEIFDDFKKNFDVTLFKYKEIHIPVLKQRVNQYYYRRQLANFLKSNNVIFFEWASEWLSAATRMPKYCGIVTRLHRYEMYEQVNAIQWDKVDKIILVSQAKKQEFLQRFPDQAGKIEVIYEAVDPERFQFSPKPFSGDIGILCHMTPRKRVYELILAFYELSLQEKGFTLHIGGDPHPQYLDYYEAMQDLVVKLHLEEKVKFYGTVNDPANWYKNIDIFISNSYSEGLQVALLESMACGCYSLSHFWNGVEELLPASNLYYSDRELIEKIKQYSHLSDEERLKEKQAMRRIVSEGFNIHQTKQAISSLVAAVGSQYPIGSK